MFSVFSKVSDPIYAMESLVKKGRKEIDYLEDIGGEVKEAKATVLSLRYGNIKAAFSASKKLQEASSKAIERANRINLIYEKMADIATGISSIFSKDFLNKFKRKGLYKERLERDKDRIEGIMKKFNQDRIRYHKIIGKMSPNHFRILAEEANDDKEILALHQKLIEEGSNQAMYG